MGTETGPVSPLRRSGTVSLPPAHRSASLLIRIAPGDTGLFRYLLEARDNLAFFTVLAPGEALLRLIFSPHQKEQVLEALAAMQHLISFEVGPWPLPSPQRPAGEGDYIPD